MRSQSLLAGGGPRLSRRQAVTGAGLGLAAVIPGMGSAAAAKDGTPEATAAGIDRAAVEAALPALIGLAEAAVADGDVPGLALAVVYEDEVVLSAGYGVRSTASDEPVTPDTVFQLASVSKPIASTVVSAIVGSGAATWDDPVIDHLLGFQLADPWATRELMIGDFFAHRSGLGGDAGSDLERIGYDRAEITERLRYLELASSPRSRYAYSNFGLTVGGLAAAAAMDMSWEDASEALLYAPLGMTSTSSRYADFEAEENRAALHVRIDDAWVPEFTFDSDTQSPAGGVSSTASDMARWLRLLLGNGTYDGAELIPAAALQAARVPRMSRGADPITGHPSFYGYGWGIGFDPSGATTLGHAGAFSLGARTMVSLHPADQLGIVVLASAFPTGVPDALAASLFDLVAHGALTEDWFTGWNAIYDSIGAAFAAGGAPYVTAPASPAAALSASAYAGTYANDYAGPVEISGTDDALELRMGPEPRVYPLRHFTHDTFTYAIDLEPPAPLSGVTFTIGPDGQAESLHVEYFAVNGQGMFPRVVAD
ncbi:MAG: serine hydrolase [Chloroflexota bacterium]|nr:serine hydrolase [Chloroflexota bacterium]